ncbi:hypothetical protein O6H91_Y299300 [Diphasiastrum complanatum]|nr:hypothetical protein O6H91_Y299300 [Diphasiastrum complanatum]
MFVVGHMTKTGDIAGPKVLEHIVDVVLYLEGERLQSHRLLRVVKNRYGSTDEQVGVFEMVEGGLVAVTNPSGVFLSERTSDASNAASGAVAVTMEGSRPLLLEVQALCSNATQMPPKRTANGIDPQRFSLIIAVLTKQARVRLSSQDIFINVVGGFELKEPAADVAVALAICSSYLEKPLPRDMAFIGEIGLGGELRSVGQLERRLTEALKLGFKKFVIPQSAAKVAKGVLTEKFQSISCSDIKEVLDKVLNFNSQKLPDSQNSIQNLCSNGNLNGRPKEEPNNGLVSWMQHDNHVGNMATPRRPLGQIPESSQMQSTEGQTFDYV